jgi:hypothetical protein
MKQTIQLKKKGKESFGKSMFGKPGPTPKGEALADSVRKTKGALSKAATAVRVFARDTKDEVAQSFGQGKPQQATGDPDPGAAKRKLRLKQITDSVDKKINPPMKRATEEIGAKAKAGALAPAKPKPKLKKYDGHIERLQMDKEEAYVPRWPRANPTPIKQRDKQQRA